MRIASGRRFGATLIDAGKTASAWVPVSSLLQPRAYTPKPEDLEPDNDLVERRRTGRKKKPKAPPPASSKKVRRKA
jgi:hypothetical protein